MGNGTLTRIPRLHVTDETSRLRTVVLGIGTSPGRPRGINAKAQAAIKAGTYPGESSLTSDLAAFEQVLAAEGVRVLRPTNVPRVNQVFARDLGFVVGKTFVRANLKLAARRAEQRGIARLLADIAPGVVRPPRPVMLEGGDVVLCGDTIFVGIGWRTNPAAVPFLEAQFPGKTVVPLELVLHSDDPRVSVLHLDCVFQPVGPHSAILFGAGFVRRPDAIFDLFPGKHLILMSHNDLRRLCCNVFSLSPTRVVSCGSFRRLNALLRGQGLEVITIPYTHVSALGGLFRCCTLPLWRS